MESWYFIPLCFFLCDHGPPGNTPEKKAATQFILSKLDKQAGDTWQRSSQYFFWKYRFDKTGCELEVSRTERVTESAVGGRVYNELIPMGAVRAKWLGDTPTLRLICEYETGCIEFSHRGSDFKQEGQLGDTRLLVPESRDLKAVEAAFLELNRLCGNAYNAPQR